MTDKANGQAEQAAAPDNTSDNKSKGKGKSTYKQNLALHVGAVIGAEISLSEACTRLRNFKGKGKGNAHRGPDADECEEDLWQIRYERLMQRSLGRRSPY